MDTGLSDKVALVSGGSGAIGRAVALALAGEGADVAVTWCANRDGAAAVVAAVSALGARPGVAARRQRRRLARSAPW